MKQEEKDLLLRGLCARLPYGVKIDIPDLFISTKHNTEVLDEIFCGYDNKFRCNASGMLIEFIKPYLFPLSSITREQLFEVQEILGKNEIEIEDSFLRIIDADRNTIAYLEILAVLEWFNKNHFDYRGLIEKGLAIDATGLNIYQQQNCISISY